MQAVSHRNQARATALKKQIGRVEKKLAVLRRLSVRYSLARLSVFLVGVFGSFVVFYLGSPWLGWLVALFSLAAFSILVYQHRKIEDSVTRHTLWRDIRATHSARMKLDWGNIPFKASTPPQLEHPFENDLDLTGKYSLRHLMDISVSHGGGKRLRDWLLSTEPDPHATLHRQTLVQELVPLSLFRDKLLLTAALASGNSKEHWDSDTLLTWLRRDPPPKSLRNSLIVLVVLAVINILLFALNKLALLPALWIASLALYVAIYYAQRRQIATFFQDALALERVLENFKFVFQYLEVRLPRTKPHLAKLCEPLLNLNDRPSTHFRRIARVAQAAQLQRNPLLWPVVNAFVPWDLYFVHRLHQDRAAIAERMPVWLDVWFELEALISVANFSYLNPDYVFPKIVLDESSKDRMIFCAHDLGHPLIADDKKACNDLTMSERGEVAIITGSNMSGKSTFLRTVGINLCLANAGGPVNASHFVTSPFRIFACIKVNDSLAEGISYFYAEVKRLKALLTELENLHRFPLFFFVDEIFRGTNNRERLIGSTAYLRALVQQNGLGLVATHDLELAKLSDTTLKLKNYHFREDVLNGRMVFDYKLRSGPCPTTNALKIMQMEGLPVKLES